MKLYYFTDSKSTEQKVCLTIESIEVDDAAYQADKFIVVDRLDEIKKRWYGPFLHEPSIKKAVESIDVTKVDSSLAGVAMWGLNLNTMHFDYLGHFVDFDSEVFEESTEEIYVLYPNTADLLHFQQLTLP